MKQLLVVVLSVISLSVMAQSGLQIGVNISPSWKLNMHRSKLTSIRSSENGYGFTIGVPIKYWINDYTAINTGIDYDFTSFDNVSNNQLVSSFRISAVQVPVMFNTHMTGHWYGMWGTGVTYNLSVRDLNLAGGSDATSLTNRVQPYLGLGVNAFAERDKGFLEVGLLGRYQLLDVWNKDYPPAESVTSHLLSVDFLFRYYF